MRAELEYIHIQELRKEDPISWKDPLSAPSAVSVDMARDTTRMKMEKRKKLVSLVIFIHLPPYKLGAKYWMTPHIAWGGGEKNPTRILLCAVDLLEGLD